MLHNNYEINVLVKGRPIQEFYHNGATFIEGRDGSNFEIEFKNLSAIRVEAVLSVDGLSVIDGKTATPTSAGYLVEPFSSIRIPGWKLTDEQVAAFVFSGKKQSYATQTTGSSVNNGVIGALVFAEKQIYGGFGYIGQMGGGIMRSVQPMHMAPKGGGEKLSKSAAPRVQTLNSSISSGLGDGYMGATLSASDAPYSLTNTMAMGAVEPVEQTLGTGFGSAQDFHTTTAQFTRGDMAGLMVLYYDDARGLRARGIELVRRRPVVSNEIPQPFAGMPSPGCTPPAGWTGSELTDTQIITTVISKVLGMRLQKYDFILEGRMFSVSFDKGAPACVGSNGFWTVRGEQWEATQNNKGTTISGNAPAFAADARVLKATFG